MQWTQNLIGRLFSVSATKQKASGQRSMLSSLVLGQNQKEAGAMVEQSDDSGTSGNEAVGMTHGMRAKCEFTKQVASLNRSLINQLPQLFQTKLRTIEPVKTRLMRSMRTTRADRQMKKIAILRRNRTVKRKRVKEN